MSTDPIKLADELKPCPFCGGKAKCNGLPSGMMGQIYCDSEECFGPKTTALTKQDSIVQWNTRASDLPHQGEGLNEPPKDLVIASQSELFALREWKASILSKCKHSDGFDALEWAGDKEGWGFVHYFIGHLETRTLHAETVLAEQDAALRPLVTAGREELEQYFNPLRLKIAAFLLARDESETRLPVPDSLIQWGTQLVKAGMQAEHSGDCTNECHACNRCIVDRTLRDADAILSLLSEGGGE